MTQRHGLQLTAWQAPASWWRRAESFRGLSPARKIRLSPGATDDIDRLLVRTTETLERVIGHEATSPELAAAARAYLATQDRGAKSDVSALGVAVVWLVCTDYPEAALQTVFADDVVARHGVRVAAEAAVLRAQLRIHHHPPSTDAPHVLVRSVTHRAHTDLTNYWLGEANSRLRSLIAALPGADHDGLVRALARHRGAAMAADLVSSFLVPDQVQWVTEDLTSVTRHDDEFWAASKLLASVISLDQAEFLFASATSPDHAVWVIGQSMNLVYSMCANIGAGTEHIVADLLDGGLTAADKKRCAAILGDFRTDIGFGLLLDRLDHQYVEPAVRAAMAKEPRRTAELLAGRAAADPRVAEILRDHLLAHPDLVGHTPDDVPPPALDATPDRVPCAPDSAVPTVLLAPPWLHRRGLGSPEVLAGAAHGRPTTTTWLPGERQSWAGAFGDGLPWLGDRTWAQVIADITAGRSRSPFGALSYAPDDLIRPALRNLPVPADVWYAGPPLRRILARFGDDAADFVLRVAVTRPVQLAGLLMPMDGSVVTSHMMRWLGSKAIRADARQWFDRHIATAALDVVAAAVGPHGPERPLAVQTLRELDRRGHRTDLLRAAQNCHEQAPRVVLTVLDSDPLDELPRRIPALPEWVNPALLPQVLLAEGRALPDAAVLNLCTMLALSRPGDVYAGLDIVRATVDVDTLAEIVWGLFERWSSVGFPCAQGWVLGSLGILGNDDTVRRLAPLLREWPLRSAHRRAAAGLQVLADIGSDAALTQLSRLAQFPRFPSLRAEAQARIQEVADALGLSPADLADRVVPDLSLAADATARFDYGDRSFVATVGAKLSLTLTDPAGSVIRAMPRPGAHDGDLAAAEYKRYRTFRKELAELSNQLIARFEQAMLTRRRWTMGSVRCHLIAHPLMWQLCRGLVWSVEAADGEPRLFRFASSRTPVDIDQNALTIRDDEMVTVPHPLTIGEEITAWARAIDEARISQPFEQLHRDVFDGDVRTRLRELEGRKTPTSRLLELTSHGWWREQPQERGAQIALMKHVDDRVAAVIMVFPGFNAANPRQWSEQKIVHAFVPTFADSPPMDPITGSELVRDLATLETQPVSGNEGDFVGAP
ncbi:DUF4132 domain-containing protein [Rhodococcus sp. D2-41]|uniref:DUF4132 domain-containing protein n=1 Tax=Speluncibacter jeojiensis TaxID=2710754 RepID=UPI00240FAD2C|nr:DUF4132 domain-containing protein [Rhodococcus sp. D2-41]MDG3011977.1 DUF4132 domain-containing protein [Rhodococcus sp. D2-41]